ncbi:uncharacterized protein BDZ99DRAFT_462958 [Mytilinidion resinicola]|uniref:GH16 domain-containing protein n=1 Tax=Mytilinidion resinicola TaxID=574789 RepID=A0A6A6YND8_9PEZI|nr:uncharacterized protein BDZ99DRAFT_462958 [Mytilinidion resinicola]KAF2810382.1 hypothetical protein BDZ99DRAFT_462958 [Mytilinidion resinicola]
MHTVRKDIQYGSFRSLIKSPPQKIGGSAMSMLLQYNDTETTEVSVMNTDAANEAWVGTFVSGEFPNRNLGMNYTDLRNNASANHNYTTLANSATNGSVNAWDYTEYRIDWTKNYINFYIGGNCTRTVLHKDNKGMPSVPAPFYLKHWSTGNKYSMEGPPKRESVASVAWVRMFFNSSTMSVDQHTDFVSRCPLTDACSMDDITIRGSTPYDEAATKKWKQASHKSVKRMPALWISVICIAFSSLLLLHAFLRRAPWRKQSASAGHGHGQPAAEQAVPEVPSSNDTLASGGTTPARKSSFDFAIKREDDDMAIEQIGPSRQPSIYSASSMYGGGETSQTGSLKWDSRATTPRATTPYSASSSRFNTTRENIPLPDIHQNQVAEYQKSAGMTSEKTLEVHEPPADGADGKIPMSTVTESALPAPRMVVHAPRQRIDYLAGLVAICALLVTVMHFGLSYVPAIVIPGAPLHHKSEYWAQKIVSPFVLNQMWLGVFFTTSTRFLVAKYLKSGNLKDIAQNAVRRTPRLMIPVSVVVLFEYFVIDCGATKFLEYTPSISWSTWPYVARFPTFGHYISEVLELIYLVPNAVPQITFNYCTGVLWTIAVQLQGSWLVLLGVIVIYEMKTPWKRFCYYAFVVVNHWYAQSWGSYLWLGLMLADLDVTYKWRPWLYARAYAYYPLLLLCWICVALGFSANVIPNWTDYNFATYENNIHPDVNSGEPLARTENAGYPVYYVPRLNGLLFAVGMQAIVEISPAVQWILSRKAFLLVFPHIFTIYLLHGLVFWSWGSWLMVLLASRGFTYSINVAVVGISSYAILFLSLPIVTPIIEALGKDITHQVWLSASEKNPPRRRTLFPFPDDLLSKRESEDMIEEGKSVVWSGPESGPQSGSSSIYNSVYKGEDKATSRFSL